MSLFTDNYGFCSDPSRLSLVAPARLAAMIVPLVKLCVGVNSIEQLETLQVNRRSQAQRRGEQPENVHRTRYRPRRDKELLNCATMKAVNIVALFWAPIWCGLSCAPAARIKVGAT